MKPGKRATSDTLSLACHLTAWLLPKSTTTRQRALLTGRLTLLQILKLIQKDRQKKLATSKVMSVSWISAHLAAPLSLAQPSWPKLSFGTAQWELLKLRGCRA